MNKINYIGLFLFSFFSSQVIAVVLIDFLAVDGSMELVEESMGFNDKDEENKSEENKSEENKLKEKEEEKQSTVFAFSLFVEYNAWHYFEPSQGKNYKDISIEVLTPPPNFS